MSTSVIPMSTVSTSTRIPLRWIKVSVVFEVSHFYVYIFAYGFIYVLDIVVYLYDIYHVFAYIADDSDIYAIWGQLFEGHAIYNMFKAYDICAYDICNVHVYAHDDFAYAYAYARSRA
jgi:hypothetical protein